MALPADRRETAAAARRGRPPLPRLVEQMRILTWFQFHLTLVTMLVALLVGAKVAEFTSTNTSPDDTTDEQLNRVLVLLLALAVTATLLGIAAALVRRGYAVGFGFVLLGEAAVLVDIVLAARAGLFLGAVTVLLLILGGWILADLFRGEVRAFLLK